MIMAVLPCPDAVGALNPIKALRFALMVELLLLLLFTTTWVNCAEEPGSCNSANAARLLPIVLVPGVDEINIACDPMDVAGGPTVSSIFLDGVPESL